MPYRGWVLKNSTGGAKHCMDSLITAMLLFSRNLLVWQPLSMTNWSIVFLAPLLMKLVPSTTKQNKKDRKTSGFLVFQFGLLMLIFFAIHAGEEDRKHMAKIL